MANVVLIYDTRILRKTHVPVSDNVSDTCTPRILPDTYSVSIGLFRYFQIIKINRILMGYLWIPSNPNNTTQSIRIKALRSAVPPSHPHSRSRRPATASHGSLAVTAARPPAHASSCSFPAAHRSLAVTAARPPARASSCSFPIARCSLAVTSARPPVRASYCSSGCAACPDRGPHIC